jgi:hypothetical protein
MSEKSARWIRFLRQYGPAAQNDSMYDETIRKYTKRVGVRQPLFSHPVESELLALFRSDSAEPVSVILTGTAGDGKSNLCGKIWHQLGGDPNEWESKEVYFQLEATIAGQSVTVHQVRDLTGLPPDDEKGRYRGKEELLQRFSRLIFSPARNEVFILAANDGQLI